MPQPLKSAKGKTGEQAVFSTCCRDETSTYYDRAKCQVARKCPNHGVHQRKSQIKRLYFSPCCGNTAFSPVFPSAEPIAKAFCWLCLWNFKEKAPIIFYGTALNGQNDWTESVQAFLVYPVVILGRFPPGATSC